MRQLEFPENIQAIVGGKEYSLDNAVLKIWPESEETKGALCVEMEGVGLFTIANYRKCVAFLTNSLVTDFQNEYPTIRIKPNPDCHDRLIILDYGEKTELVYHCGASSKDAGKKLCAINQITETAIIHPVIDRLLTLPDKQI